MTLQLSKTTQGELQNISDVLQISEEKIIERAIYFYGDALKDEMALKNEMNIWDNISDEILLECEQNL
jgi:hypothetical protein